MNGGFRPSRTRVLDLEMLQFTKLTASKRLGVAMLIPSENNNVTPAEAEELVQLVEEFAREFRRHMARPTLPSSLRPVN